MPSSRAIVVLGMHRSGTSVLTRGLQSLGVYLGNDFLESKPDNPTGYWEDKGIVALNERLLSALGIDWESTSRIDAAQWQNPEVQRVWDDAAAYLQTNFLQCPVWGFKDPRTIRVLPFWRGLFQQLGANDEYVLAIRNPLGVAISLLRRQNMNPETSHTMSLVHLVPYLHEIAARPLVVADYDLLIAQPHAQLNRIASRLNIPLSDDVSDSIEQFCTGFLDPNLRHGHFAPQDFDTIPGVSPLIREAYLRLYQMATDQIASTDPEFWHAWEGLREAVEALVPVSAVGVKAREIPARKPSAGPSEEKLKNEESDSIQAESRRPASGISEPAASSGKLTPPICPIFKFTEHPLFPGTGVQLFVVTGTQRTGTNLLREILNTNEQIAMQGEVLTPSPAPAHWENFIRGQPAGTFPSVKPGDVEKLLDRYFQFVLYRVRNHWVRGDKSGCRAIGVDIKYNQMRQLAPETWSAASAPFLLSYLKARGATLIHMTRRNVIHCAISAMIAAQRNFWHNYEGEVVQGRYLIDIEQCLKYARTIEADRDELLKSAGDGGIIECCYEDLVAEIESVATGEEIPDQPGPLQAIANALGLPFQFRNQGRLQKTINVPYTELLLNHDALAKAIKDSEFSGFAATLE